MKTKLFALIVISLFVTSACTTYDRCMRKYGQMQIDTAIVYVEYVIPRDSVVTHIHIDSIQHLIPGHVYEVKSDRAKIQYWKDQYTQLLYMQAECDSIIIKDTIYVPYIKTEFAPIPEKKPKSFFDKPAVQISSILFLIALIILIIKTKIK